MTRTPSPVPQPANHLVRPGPLRPFFRTKGLFRLVAGLILLLALTPSWAVRIGLDDGEDFLEPARYLSVELAELGLGAAVDNGADFPLLEARAAAVTYCLGRYGFGLAGLEYWTGWGLDNPWQAGVLVPVHFRYDLRNDRQKTGFLYNSVPACFAEITLGVPQIQSEFEPGLYLRLSTTAEVEYFGLGAGIEAGIAGFNPWKPLMTGDPPSRMVYLEVKLRLLTGSFRLVG